MKNINLAPSSPKPVKVVWGSKPFIFIFLFLLALLSFVFFSRFISSDKQWQGGLVSKIGSVLDFEKPKKTKKISVSKKSSEVKKAIDNRSKEQKPVENIKKEEIEKEAPISKETNKEIAGIEIKKDEGLIKSDSKIVISGIEEKPISEKKDEKVAGVEIEKGLALTEVKSMQKFEDEEKTEQIESPLKPASSYYIQVCSCVIKENADKIFRSLGKQGYSPIMKEIVRQVMMHNIYTDGFTKKSEAMELLDRLKADGFDSVLLPSSGGRYKIRITSCFYMESAKKVIKRLKRLGYETSIRKEFIPTRMYSVLLGSFESLQEVEATSQELIKNGYPQPILKSNPQA